jgi:hypothetical protein
MSTNLAVLYLSTAAATSKDLTKGRAEFTFNPPMSFPANTPIKLAVSGFSYTNYFLNISAALANNKFYYTDDLLTPDKYSITIPDGSYNVSDLSAAIDVGVINNGHTSGLITLTPDFASNRVYFTINAAGWQIYFKADSPYVLLGTTLLQKIPAAALTTGVYSELAPSIATFNSITGIYLKSSLTNLSNFSGRPSNVIASIVPTAPIGSIQNTQPFFPVWINASTLAGQTISNMYLELVDQADAPLNLSDDYAATIMISTN